MSLDALAADATRADTLSADQRRTVMLKVAAIMAALAATSPREMTPPTIEPPGHLLTPEAAAERFGVSRRWLLAHANEIPGMRRLSRKTIRFNERALRRYLNGVRA